MLSSLIMRDVIEGLVKAAGFTMDMASFTFRADNYPHDSLVITKNEQVISVTRLNHEAIDLSVVFFIGINDPYTKRPLWLPIQRQDANGFQQYVTVTERDGIMLINPLDEDNQKELARWCNTWARQIRVAHYEKSSLMELA